MLYFARWKVALILLVVIAGFVYASPNLIKKETLETFPDWAPNQQINLGLDLRGGAYLQFGVGFEAVYQERLEAVASEAGQRLGEARILREPPVVANDAVVTRIINEGDIAQAREVLEDIAQPVEGSFGIGGTQDIEISVADDGAVRIVLSDAVKEQIRIRTINQSIEIIRRRLDEFGTTEPSIQRQGEDRIVVQVPGAENPQEIIDRIGRTAKMEFRMVDTSVPVSEVQAGRRVPGSELLPQDDISEPFLLVKKRVEVSGDRLIDASPGFHPDSGEPVVNFAFDTRGARQFGSVTQENPGRRFAIVLDNRVISAPRINEPILQGRGFIYGNFSIEEATELSALLRAGALPAPLTVFEQRSVGAELGADSIAAGEMAAIFGFCAVIVFMFLAYSTFGVFSNVSLIVNMILIAAALSALQATLTLPGIAGIVLTIGMAVDANVLIYERIREERRGGKTVINSVEAGYQRALGTIMDANITTLIAAAILFSLGSGPVRGFAVTLAIGIVTSVFTAFVLSRLMVATWVRLARPKALPI